MQLLIVKEQGSPDRVFDLFGEDVLIGRSTGCDLRLSNVSVSREHACVRWHAGLYIVEDKGSHNGVYVNDKRIESHELQTGDRIRLGKYELMYVHERIPKVLQSADIDALPRWHQVTIGTADDSTYRISEAMMERMISARQLLERGCIVREGDTPGRWTPGQETLVIGKGADIPITGLLVGASVAEILWNGRKHVIKRTRRMTSIKINGRAYSDATMLDHGDQIEIGKLHLRYLVG